ncbi:HPr family phosphocarrier protein [Bacillus altitudinis]|uniref:HPr family phosphocarrier protein n=1 Tax=Bacillus altitudinis TaxID=293387 RepID=UPI001643D9B5
MVKIPQQAVKLTPHSRIHPPPPTLLLQTPSKYHPHINLQYNPKTLNLKSIIPLISLPIPKAATITISPSPSHQNHPLPPLKHTIKTQPLPH